MRQLFILTILVISISCSRTTETTVSPTTDTLIFETPDQIELDTSDDFPDYVERITLPDSLLIDRGNIIYGDFNADFREDFASKLTNTKNGFHGIIIVHNINKPEYFVFGAGQEINGMKNLDWIDVFKPMPKGELITPTLVDSKTGDIIGSDKTKEFRLIGDGIYMHIDEAGGGGIIFWTGNNYEWYHLE